MKFVRREPGRDGKILSDHRQEGMESPSAIGEMKIKRKKMDAAAEIGRNPLSKHQIQPEYGE